MDIKTKNVVHEAVSEASVDPRDYRSLNYAELEHQLHRHYVY